MIKLIDLLSEGPRIGELPVRQYKLVQGKEDELNKVKNPKVVDYIKNNPENITMEDLAKFLSVREQAALQFINVLKQAGALVPKNMTEKKGKDQDGDGDIDSKDWKISRNIAIKKAIAANLKENDTPKHKIIAQLMGSDFYLAKKEVSEWDDKDHDLYDRIMKMASEEGKVPKLKENQDHEVAMAQASLKSIIQSAAQLMNKLGNMERDIPGWIQDHITNAENYIDQAAQGFHELNDNE